MMRNALRAGLIALALAGVSAPPARGQTAYSWANGNTGTWQSPSNWNPNGVPTVGDSVLIGDQPTYTVSNNGGNIYAGSLSISNKNATLALTGAQSGGGLQVYGGGSGDIFNAGTINLKVSSAYVPGIATSGNVTNAGLFEATGNTLGTTGITINSTTTRTGQLLTNTADGTIASDSNFSIYCLSGTQGVSNSGQIRVSAGNSLTFHLSGGVTFAQNDGAINVDPAGKLAVSQYGNGALTPRFDFNGGTISGRIDFTSVAVTQSAVGGTNTFAFSGANNSLSGDTAAGQTVILVNAGTLTVNAGYTNNGTFTTASILTNSGTINTVSGAFTNAATGTVRIGINGGSVASVTNLNAPLNNQGLLVTDGSFTAGAANAAHTNSGTMTIGSGSTLTYTGASLSSSGTINGTGSLVTTALTGSVTNSGTISPGTSSTTGTLGLTLKTLANTGSINVTAGNTLAIQGTNTVGPTVTQSAGSINVAPTGSMSIVSASSTAPGAFNFTGGTITGRIDFQSVAVTQTAAGGISTFGFTKTGNSLTGNTSLHQQILLGSSTSSGTLTVASGFANFGTFSSTGAFANTIASGSGVFFNAGTGILAIESKTGNPNYTDTLSAALNNQNLFLVNGNVTVGASGAAHTNGGAATTTIAAGQTLTYVGAGLTNSGVLRGAGTLTLPGTATGFTFTNTGTIAPGTAMATGILTVNFSSNGNNTFSLGSGTLAVRLGGVGAGNGYDQLKVASGTAAVGGNLNVSLFNGYAPTAADSFTVVTASGRTGTFDNMPTNNGTYYTLDNSYSFHVHYNSNSVVLDQFTPVPEPATVLGVAALAFGAWRVWRRKASSPGR